MKLVKILSASDGVHKFVAEFETDSGRIRRVPFGAAGMDDYTLTHDTAQRDRYRARHHKDLRTNDPTRAGFLSYYILWGDSTNLRANVAAYKKRFNL